jgi:hypothetical protein
LISCDYKPSSGGAPAQKRRRSRPITAEEREEHLLPQLKPTPGTELRFTEFPERNFPEGSTPAEITHHSLDSTYVLETMIAKYTRCVCSKVGVNITLITKVYDMKFWCKKSMKFKMLPSLDILKLSWH